MSFEDLILSTSFWSSAIVLLALVYQWWKKPHPNFPPFFRGVPGLGVIPYLDKFPQKIFKKWSMDLNESVIAVRLGSKDTVILNSYDTAYEVSVTLLKITDVLKEL